MRDSQRYRRNGADCLLAAREAREPHYQRLYLSMAQSWLSLARQNEVAGDLLANWRIAEPIKADGIVLPFPTPPEPLPCQQSTKADRSRQRPLQG
jgi:hypothetical protein